MSSKTEERGRHRGRERSIADGKAARLRAPRESQRDFEPSASRDPATMARYGRLCGWTLARAHARSGDRIAIAAYLGRSDKFDEAVTEFGATYAHQTERDHAALAEAVASGRAQARPDI